MPTTAAMRPTCHYCETLIVEELYPVYPFIGRYASAEVSLVCLNCRTRYFAECERCARCVRASTRTRTSDGTRVCYSCLRAAYTHCDRCGEYFPDGEDCPNCGCQCPDCRYDDSDDSDGIYDYSYQPNLIFRGAGRVHFGFEAEVSTPSRSVDTAARVANDGFEGVAYLKEDGSIQGDGFEIVTHPMTYAWALENFRWDTFTELGRMGCSGDGNGIHVHVSRTGFDGVCHAYRWMKFIYRNQRHVQRYAGRQSNQWAPFRDGDRQEIRDKAKGARGHDRYAAINTTNSDTFELRIFAGSVDPGVVKAALGFAAATIEYTRTLSAHTIVKRDGWSWKAFVAWLSEGVDDLVPVRPEYAPVLAHIERTAA